ncbi:MAG TPA: glycosyltransferase 87 family protein [Solirubrobacteraceae bacterium]|nr:glycosyltransferase 87 family protein [Solirubrobacteraceae bacterium]
MLVFLVASFLVTRPPWSEGVQVSDVPDYELYGEAVVAGDAPYRDVKIEYPPGSVAAFALPAVFADGKDEYARAFAWLMRLCGVLLIVAVGVSLRALGSTTREVACALALVSLMPLLLGRIVLQRFDLMPAALLALALAALLVRRDRLAFAALALGVGTKLYPIVAVPIFLAAVARRRGPRAAAACLLVFAAVLGAMVVPFAISGPDGLADALTRQAGRPLHHESTGGALLLALHQLSGLDLETARSHGSTNLPGEPADTLASLGVLLQAAALAAIWLVAVRRPPSDQLIVYATAAAVTAFVVLGKVLSPQFVIWLVALVPLVRGRRGLTAAALVGAAALLTQAYFPRRYYALEELAAVPSWLVAARDAALLAVLAVLVSGLRSGVPSRARP